MVELFKVKSEHQYTDLKNLIKKDELVLIIDDSPEILLLISTFLKRQNLSHKTVTSTEEFFRVFQQEKVALVILDIILPDDDGIRVLKQIAPANPHLGIIMVTGITDLETALECLRFGADDYLTKPFGLHQFNRTVYDTLLKRRLILDNQIFQQELESTNFRTQFLHHLNLKMNNAYLNAVELNGLLQAILVGITSQEGLKFNRAFLALFDEDQQKLRGKMAIGPARKKDANQVWSEIVNKGLSLEDMIDAIIAGDMIQDHEIKKIACQLQISSTDKSNILIVACDERRSIMVENGVAEGHQISRYLLDLLEERNFIITPLFSPRRALGVIIADNFVTAKPISREDIKLLEFFATQASLAIEHVQLHNDTEKKIKELEQTTEELEKSKNLLVEAEKHATIGHISAQIVHSLRNPITAIGGTARLLAKKTDDPSILEFLQIITKETEKVEATLEDLFLYVDNDKLDIKQRQINTLIEQSVLLFYNQMQEKRIICKLNLHEQNPMVSVDEKKIKKVFHHLLKNAIEAMEDGGNIVIRSEIIDNITKVTFSDNGIGVEQGVLNKTRDAFYTTKTYGTGMGLTIVERILDMHQADFNLHHNEAGGLDVIISFQQYERT